jgi:hypothetical protein
MDYLIEYFTLKESSKRLNESDAISDEELHQIDLDLNYLKDWLVNRWKDANNYFYDCIEESDDDKARKCVIGIEDFAHAIVGIVHIMNTLNDYKVGDKNYAQLYNPAHNNLSACYGIRSFKEFVKLSQFKRLADIFC